MVEVIPLGKFDGVLLVTDYDDTLVDRAKQVPRRTRSALTRFTSQGGRFTIASGRGLDAIRPCLTELPVNAPVILSNGTQIYDFASEQLLCESHLPATAREDFSQVLQAFPSAAVEIFAQGQLYCVNPNIVTQEHLRITRQTALERPMDAIPNGWIYAKFEEDTPCLLEIQTFLRQRFPSRYEAIFSHPYLLEVADGSCGKGPGVLRLAELLGIRPAHIYCAGDNENDLSMLEIAAVSFTPAGSTQAALHTADVVVCDCNQGALADVVEYLEARYGSRSPA